MDKLTDFEYLLSSIILSVGSLLFLLLIMITYFSRKKIQNMRTKIYEYQLITTLLLVLTEFVEFFIILYFYSPLALFISFKLHWFMGIAIFIGVYYYAYIFMDNIDVKSIKDLINYNLHTKLMTIVHILFIVAFMVAPFDFTEISRRQLHFFPGWASYIMYAHITVVETVLFFHLIKNYKNILPRRKIALISLLVLLLFVFGFQIMLPNICIVVTGAVIQVFFLYFNVENPDLIMVEELEQVNTNIDKSNRAKTDFLSNMSYEIRTPMKQMLDFSEELVHDEFNNEKATSNIKNIIVSGNNLLNTVDNILDISKIESGEELIELREYSLANIVLELQSIIDSRLFNKQVKFIIEVDENLPSKLYGDSTKLFQVLLNVLTNSVEHTDIGIIRLKVYGNTSGDNIRLHIKVSDSGDGMDKEEYDELMEILSKLDMESYSDLGGKGLGLAISKKYLDLMNGTMKIETAYKAGTITYIDINQKVVDKSPVGSIYINQNGEKKHNYMDCTGYDVLIVDDNKLNLLATKKILSKYKFNIEEVDNSKDCIYRIKEERKYDLIFIDHMMPEMDGIQVVHILRKLEGYELPPIIMLTANVITGMKEMYIKEGFDDYLSKPINIAELEKIINKYIIKK